MSDSGTRSGPVVSRGPPPSHSTPAECRNSNARREKISNVAFYGLKCAHQEDKEDIERERNGIQALFPQLFHKLDLDWARFCHELDSAWSRQFEVVILAGHANSEGLQFENNQADMRHVARLIAGLGNLRLLILNCCDTETLAAAVLSERRRRRRQGQTSRSGAGMGEPLAVLCWHGKANFEGAAYVSKGFMEYLVNSLKRNPSGNFSTQGFSLAHLERGFQERLLLGAFQRAIKFAGHKGFAVRYCQHDVGQHDLGEPMLLPFFSSQVDYHAAMLAKYKVAETGIELIKRLKTIVENAYLTKADSKITTLYHFGEFLAWLYALGEETELEQNELVAGVEQSFIGPKPPSADLLNDGDDIDLAVFKNTNLDRCFWLRKMDMRAIAEVMLEDPSDPNSVRKFNRFNEMWILGEPQSLSSSELDAYEQEQMAELRDGFAKLEAHIDLLHKSPCAESMLEATPQKELALQATWLDQLQNLFPPFTWSEERDNARQIATAQKAISDPNKEQDCLYIKLASGKIRLRRDSAVYHRIAWIHDSVLKLVSALDPSIKEDLKGEDHVEKIFRDFRSVDKCLYRV